MSNRINTGLSEPSAEHIRHTHSAIIEGFEDIKEGRYFQSTGNWKKDKELFKRKETEDWK